MVEIGAGLGSLTLALAEAGARVTAVEVDRHVLPVLRAQVEPARRRGGRGRRPDRATSAELLGEPRSRGWALVANLPYNVAVPLVIRVLEEAPQVASLLVMVQREVGERLAAGPGDEAYGAVSVKVAYWATASVVGQVPASVFIPRPRVESVLVRLDRRRRHRGRARSRPGPGRPSTTGCSRWCGAGSPTGARCSAARSSTWWPPRRSPAPASPRRPGPRSSTWTSGSAWPGGGPEASAAS